MNNQLSLLNNVSVNSCPFVVSNSLSMFSVCSVVKEGGAQ
jgi:hypothetical protein